MIFRFLTFVDVRVLDEFLAKSNNNDTTTTTTNNNNILILKPNQPAFFTYVSWSIVVVVAVFVLCAAIGSLIDICDKETQLLTPLWLLKSQKTR